jgi:hypothetical protein
MHVTGYSVNNVVAMETGGGSGRVIMKAKWSIVSLASCQNYQNPK